MTATVALPEQPGPKFRTKAGRLTRYSLACGYIERHEANDIQLDLWQERPGNVAIHVRAHDFKNHNRLFWESFQSLTDARRFFDAQKKSVLFVS